MKDMTDTFPGAVVRFVLDELLKDDLAATAWERLSEEARESRLDAMADRAADLCQELITDVQRDGQTALKVGIESVTFKDAVKISLTASKQQEHVYEIAQNAGGAGILILPQLALELTTEAGPAQDDAFVPPGGGIPPELSGPPKLTPPGIIHDNDKPDKTGE